MCSFRRKRYVMANQLRDNNEEENDDGYEFVGPADQIEDQQRVNNEEENNGGYEFDPRAEQIDNSGDRHDGGSEFDAPRDNGRDENGNGYKFVPPAEQRGNSGEGNNDNFRIVINKDFSNRQVSSDGINQDIVDNQDREYLGGQRPVAGNKDMSFPQGLPMLQETSNGVMENLNIPGNQHRGNCSEQGCEVTYGNEVAPENDNQQLDDAYEDMNASQALVTSQERSESATTRRPVENDDDVSGTYTNPVQCTDDIINNF